MPAGTLAGRWWDALQSGWRDAQGSGEAAHAADTDVLAGLGAHDGLASDARAVGKLVLGECTFQA
jgi:hypothetical protein